MPLPINIHLTEGRSTGIPKIRRAMARNGSPKAIFETDKDKVYFLTTIPIHPEFKKAKQQKREAPDKHRTSTDQVPTKLRSSTVEVPQEFRRAIEQIRESVPGLSQVVPSLSQVVPSEAIALILHRAQEKSPIKILMELAGYTNRTRFRNEVIKPLIKAELLVLTIPDKPQSSKQQYYTTEKEKKLLKG